MPTVHDKQIGIVVLRSDADIQAANEYADYLAVPLDIISVETYRSRPAKAIIILQRSQARRLQLIINDRVTLILWKTENKSEVLPLTQEEALKQWRESAEKDKRRLSNASSEE